jgi:hypothetical protein
MCNHEFKILHSEVYSSRISKTETRLTKIDILYCELCEINETDREEITIDKDNPEPLPKWAKGNHKKIF